MTEANRPRPRPNTTPDTAQIPDGGIAVALPPALPNRTPSRKHGGRAGGVRRFLRTRRGKWTAVSVVAVLALIAGLLSQGFLSSPGDPLPDAPPAAGATGATGALDSFAPSVAASTSPTATPTGPATAEDIKKELQARAGQLNNPLNRLRSSGAHNVTVSVRSAGSVNSVGYLLPTSINTNFAYGNKKVSASSFGFTTKAVGAGYLALVFIQAGNKDVPVTCTVSVDGRVTNRETTAGAYGRQVCLG